jgi:hypothetical protein
LNIPKTPQIGMRVGATSSKKLIFRLELTPLKPPDIAKPNWKGANRKLCGRQRLPTSFRQILREEIAEAGLPLLANERLRRDRHTHHLAHLGAAPEYGFFRQSKDGPLVLRKKDVPCRTRGHHELVESVP